MTLGGPRVPAWRPSPRPFSVVWDSSQTWWPSATRQPALKPFSFDLQVAGPWGETLRSQPFEGHPGPLAHSGGSPRAAPRQALCGTRAPPVWHPLKLGLAFPMLQLRNRGPSSEGTAQMQAHGDRSVSKGPSPPALISCVRPQLPLGAWWPLLWGVAPPAGEEERWRGFLCVPWGQQKRLGLWPPPPCGKGHFLPLVGATEKPGRGACLGAPPATPAPAPPFLYLCPCLIFLCPSLHPLLFSGSCQVCLLSLLPPSLSLPLPVSVFLCAPSPLYLAVSVSLDPPGLSLSPLPASFLSPAPLAASYSSPHRALRITRGGVSSAGHTVDGSRHPGCQTPC